MHPSFVSLAAFISLLSPSVTDQTVSAAPLDGCAELYGQRAQLNQAMAAFDCYNARVGLNDAESRSSLEGALLSSAWVVNKLRPEGGAADTAENRTQRLTWISRALGLAHQLVNSFPEAGSGYYWRAVYVSFDCREAGFGPKGIACIFKAIGSVENDLQRALQLEPTYHAAGPERVLAYKGLSEVQYGRPGANLNRPLQAAAAAYARVPQCTLNHMVYAKLLMATKQRDKAKEVLQRLVALNPNDTTQVDPLYLQEAVEDQREARAVLEKL